MIDSTDTNFWRDNPEVVLPEQLAIAVYTNQNADIVVRQERAWDEDSDVFVIIAKENVRRVAEALLAEIGEDLRPTIAGLLPAPSGSRSSGAERQKRYRDRHRNVTHNATPDDVTASLFDEAEGALKR
jgi:hypothetical protein